MMEARSTAELAASLYSSQVAQPRAMSPTPSATAELAQRLYPESDPPPAEALPIEVQALRDGDPTRSIYDAQKTYKQALSTAFAGVDGTPAAAAERRAWGEVFADVGLSSVEAVSLASLTEHAYPSEAVTAGWVTEAKASLEREFGDAAAALADARLLVRRDPRLLRVLNASGLGDHPLVVTTVARAARRQIAAKKLNRR